MARHLPAVADPRSYEHPFDQRALDTLEGTPGLEKLVRLYHEYGLERIFQVQLTGSALQVTDKTMPELHTLLTSACSALCLSPVPDLYVQNSGELNAMTLGVEKPVVVLNSELVDRFTPEETKFVISHELGHIKSRHVLYLQVGQWLPVIGNAVSSVIPGGGIGKLLTSGLQWALGNWKQMAEFTADRAGLLACQDLAVSTQTLAKLTGLPKRYEAEFNSESFLRQSRRFSALDYRKLNKVAKIILSLHQTHPQTVVRAAELQRWVDRGEYDRVRNGTTTSPSSTPETQPAAYCPGCGNRLEGHMKFCAACGRRLDLDASG